MRERKRVCERGEIKKRRVNQSRENEIERARFRKSENEEEEDRK